MAGGGGDGGELDIEINLTALLDVLTNLLFFLMFGFAAQKASMDLDKGVELPSSNAEAPPEKALEVTLGREEFRVNKKPILTMKQVVGMADQPRIEPFYKELMKLKNERLPETIAAPEILLVLCDRTTRYGTLRRVLMT